MLIDDEKLAVINNFLGATIFLLIVLYHYVVANSPTQEK